MAQQVAHTLNQGYKSFICVRFAVFLFAFGKRNAKGE